MGRRHASLLTISDRDEGEGEERGTEVAWQECGGDEEQGEGEVLTSSAERPMPARMSTWRPARNDGGCAGMSIAVSIAQFIAVSMTVSTAGVP